MTDCGGPEADTINETWVCFVLLSCDVSTDHYPAAPDTVPSHVSFEVLGADGEWSAYTSTEGGIEPSALRKHPVASSIGPEPVLEDMHTHSDQNTDVSLLTHTVRFLDNFATEMAPEEIIWDLNLPGVDSMSDGQLEFRLPSAPESDPGFNFDIWTPRSFDLAHFYSSALNDLPFKQFQRELKTKGICPYALLFLLAVLITQVSTSGICTQIHPPYGPMGHRSLRLHSCGILCLAKPVPPRQKTCDYTSIRY
jgi:hypothetical protein